MKSRTSQFVRLLVLPCRESRIFDGRGESGLDCRVLGSLPRTPRSPSSTQHSPCRRPMRLLSTYHQGRLSLPASSPPFYGPPSHLPSEPSWWHDQKPQHPLVILDAYAASPSRREPSRQRTLDARNDTLIVLTIVPGTVRHRKRSEERRV